MKVLMILVSIAHIVITYFRPLIKFIQQEHLMGTPDDGIQINDFFVVNIV